VILEFEHRTSHLLGRGSTTWDTPPAFFWFRCFWDKSLTNYLPGLARITGMSHHLGTGFSDSDRWSLLFLDTLTRGEKEIWWVLKALQLYQTELLQVTAQALRRWRAKFIFLFS
jgi:hypothetical protein